MAENPLVLVHGWSDHSGSFERLARYLRQALGREVSTVDLADWVSLDDDVTYNDLAEGMQRAWTARGHPLGGRATDVLVHSTGALVVRTWLVKHCQSVESPPIKRLLQLAPANFGSPLAHHGRSLIGRARMGFQVLTGGKQNDIRRAFEPGELLLRGLELASPFTWDLAMADRFGAHAGLYREGRILSTVLVGNEGNVLLAEFDGSDGVVRTSGANMACAMSRVEFAAMPETLRQRRPRLKIVEAEGQTAFRVVNGFRHSDIVLNDARLSKARKGESKKRFGVSQYDALELMVRALTVDDAGFDAWRSECDELVADLTRELDRKRDDEVHGHMSLVVRVRNQYDHPVDDFVLEIYDDDDFAPDGGPARSRTRSITRDFQRYVIDDVHTCRSDTSCRCFHLDLAAFNDRIAEKITGDLLMSVTARPVLSEGVRSQNTVGYYTLRDRDIGSVAIPRSHFGEVFKPHRTLLLDLRLERRQRSDLVRIDAAPR